MSPEDHAFEWGKEPPEDWKQVSEWHGRVSASTGISALTDVETVEQNAKFNAFAKRESRGLEFFEHHLPFYETSKAQAMGF